MDSLKWENKSGSIAVTWEYSFEVLNWDYGCGNREGKENTGDGLGECPVASEIN